MKPQLRVIDNEHEHPLDYARRKIKKWRSDAESQRLPVANQDHSGAPSLRVDEVIERSLPDHARK